MELEVVREAVRRRLDHLLPARRRVPERQVDREHQRRDVFTKYIGEVVAACERMTKVDPKKLFAQLEAVARTRTLTADMSFDDEGNFVKPQRAGKLDGDQNVVVVERETGTVYEGDEAGKSSAAAKNAKPARAAAADGQLFEDHEAA